MIQMTMNPLPPGPLRAKIEDLTTSVGFPLNRIFVYEGTIRSRYLLLATCKAGIHYPFERPVETARRDGPSRRAVCTEHPSRRPSRRAVEKKHLSRLAVETGVFLARPSRRPSRRVSAVETGVFFVGRLNGPSRRAVCTEHPSRRAVRTAFTLLTA